MLIALKPPLECYRLTKTLIQQLAVCDAAPSGLKMSTLPSMEKSQLKYQKLFFLVRFEMKTKEIVRSVIDCPILKTMHYNIYPYCIAHAVEYYFFILQHLQ